MSPFLNLHIGVDGSHILKVPFDNSVSGIVYIWIGEKTTQEEAIHAEQMGRTMFEVCGECAGGCGIGPAKQSVFPNRAITPMWWSKRELNQRTSSGWPWEEWQTMSM